MVKLTLFQRVFFYFLVIIFISLVATSTITYWQSSREFDRYMYDQMSSTINNAMHHTNIYLEDYERKLLSLLGTENVQKFVSLSGDEHYEHYLYGSVIKDVHFKNITVRDPDIASVYLISSNGQYIVLYNQLRGLRNYHQTFEPEKTYNFLNRSISKVGEVEVLDHSIIFPHEDQLMTVAQKILSRHDVSEYAGIIGIEIHKDALERLWAGIDLGEQGHFFVVNEKGNIIYHPDQDSIGTRLHVDLRQKINNNTGEMIYDHVGDDSVLLSLPSNYANWNLVVSMPLQELRKPIENIRTNTLAMSGIALIIALFFVIHFGRSITGPIKTLKRGMIETEQGNWISLPLTGRNDEMDDLTRRYNMMVSRLSELIDKVRKAEIKEREIQVERQKAELHALQLQVNPHFLYNTLETISSYGMIKDSDEITNIVKYLSEMFRYAVRTDLEVVTVTHELKHVHNYIQIINYRTGWEFEVDLVIPPEYLDHHTVRLTLQPIVENVFKHAFPDGLEMHHFIRIDAFKLNDEFIVSVEDNGVGFSEDALKLLNKKLTDSKIGEVSPKDNGGGGIGIINVHRRIQMVFGESYGLFIESKAKKGTKVYMRMPFRKS